ncbi:helix-turn-helix transcriptional regulator [Rossellomorea aquimaris]|uniref:helix-turn-helix transcriptional regulator n=1 Tax=Rossellomorea aquimaris TaxID=189382 RepID=UPI0007D05935|nr:helix-turn-helix domain-containing protein [Rossellomorea aquimaris]
MDPTLKITGVLSDPTRYSIYQYVCETKREVSVQNIADEFDLHPNVARLHLSKLEEIRVLHSELKKTGKGGRPGKLYFSSDEVVQLSFPKRDFAALSEVAIRSLMKLGQTGYNILVETGYEYGQEMVKEYLQSHRLELSILTKAEKLKMILELANSLEFNSMDLQSNQFSFQYHHCPFKETALIEPAFVCGLHNSILKGGFEILFNVEEFKQEESMLNQCSTCSYHVIVTN